MLVRCNISICFVFFYFEFKIRLIKLGLFFQKTKIPVFELTAYWFPVRNHNHYTKEPTVYQSFLTDFSWIHLILLIKLIQYEIGETRLFYKRFLYRGFRGATTETYHDFFYTGRKSHIHDWCVWKQSLLLKF